MRNAITAVVAGAALIVAAAPVAAEGDPAAGRRLADTLACNTCHGLMVEGDAMAPYLAGQKKDYLIRQLEVFREQRTTIPGPYKTIERHHPLMSSSSRPLSDANIADLAEYFAGLPCVPRRGFAETQVPRPKLVDRCGFCHGETGVTPYIGYPNIGGQKKPYLVQQLLAFRKSASHGAGADKIKEERFHRMMEPSLYDLSDGEIEALAEYYSKQSCR